MKIKQVIATTAITVGMCFAANAVLFPLPASAFQVLNDYGHVRGLVDRTQSDLRTAMALEPEGSKQHDRYRDAQRALSEFDRHLTKGHFDKGELDRCVDHLKSVLDHNTLQATSRDALLHDIEDLRITRDRFDH